MKAVHSYKGKFLGMKVDQLIENDVRRLLAKVGEFGAERMKTRTEPHDWKGRLSDSITWVTKYESGGMGGAAEKEDMLSPPNDSHDVDIGTGCPYGVFRERGAGPHKNKLGSEEFIANMKEWCLDKLGLDADGAPEEQYAFWRIIGKIRQGQDAVPFAFPSIGEIYKFAEAEAKVFNFARHI